MIFDLATIRLKAQDNAPVGHTRGFRQKIIPDRREFDKLMESGSRVLDFGRFFHPGTRGISTPQNN
jgi:hypothetical protein